jgi:hypothetical protein
MAKQRQLFRVAIDRTGIVRRHDQTFPCKVVDLTEKGVRLQVDGEFSVGEEMHLEFALTEGDVIGCTIQVTHSRPPHIGAAIVQVAPEIQQRLSSFIEELNALNMTGF